MSQDFRIMTNLSSELWQRAKTDHEAVQLRGEVNAQCFHAFSAKPGPSEHELLPINASGQGPQHCGSSCLVSFRCRKKT